MRSAASVPPGRSRTLVSDMPESALMARSLGGPDLSPAALLPPLPAAVQPVLSWPATMSIQLERECHPPGHLDRDRALGLIADGSFRRLLDGVIGAGIVVWWERPWTCGEDHWWPSPASCPCTRGGASHRRCCSGRSPRAGLSVPRKSIWFRGESFPFGVNDTGLITVYSKRITQLPATIQRTIVVHNATPEGGPSRELLAAEMEVSPANTVAPEEKLSDALLEVDRVWKDRYGVTVIHPETGGDAETLAKCHRFTALKDSELPRLAKELIKYLVERLDKKAIAHQAPAWTGEGEDKRGSLALLSDLLKAGGRQAQGVKVLRDINEFASTSPIAQARTPPRSCRSSAWSCPNPTRSRASG
jgi:hypothetical protein